MTYFLFVHRPNADAVRKKLGYFSRTTEEEKGSFSALSSRIEDFEARLKKSNSDNSELLKALKEAVKESKDDKNKLVEVVKRQPIDGSNNVEVLKVANSLQHVIPVLMFACNRVTVKKALDSLLAYRKNKEKFPIIVSQVKLDKAFLAKNHSNAILSPGLRSFGDDGSHKKLRR